MCVVSVWSCIYIRRFMCIEVWKFDVFKKNSFVADFIDVSLCRRGWVNIESQLGLKLFNS